MAAGDTQIMIAGNLGDDPELRFIRLGSQSRSSASHPPRGTSVIQTLRLSSPPGTESCRAFPDRHDPLHGNAGGPRYHPEI